MNNIIKEQLLKLKVAQIPQFDDNTTQIIIKKTIPEELKIMEVEHYYLIQLSKRLLDPPEEFTLHSNWNNNIIPKNEYMKCVVIQVMGKMIKINGIGFDEINGQDLEDTWTGWLPRSEIKMIGELN